MEDDGERTPSPGRHPAPPARGTFSRLLADIAAAPRRDLRAAWDRGFRPGDVIVDRFELVEPLGRGGFGVVLKARDRKLNRFVAFKAIPPGGQPDELVQQEAEVAAQLQHDHLVRLYDYGRCPSGAYLIFELLRGETLARRLARGPLAPPEAVRIARQVTAALAHAHRHGVLHRDLKPSNVFLTEDGNAKLLDFGLAYYFGEGPSRSGTPGYMAPEQVRGGPEDPRTDVFAVGVLLREMVSGVGPAAAAPAPAAPGRPGGFPPALAGLVSRATDPDPGRRPPDAARLAAELETLGRGLAAARRRRAGLALLLAGGLAGGAAAMLSYLWISRPTVAVADVENASGDPDLDGLSDLLITSLESSPRLRVLPRQRIRALAGEAGAAAERVGCGTARRAVSGLDAVTLLCGRVRRAGAGYGLELDSVDPEDGEKLFRLEDSAPSKQGLPALLDRVSARVRRKLSPALASARTARPIAEQTTESLEAHRHYFEGVRCADRAVHGQDCSAELRRALALDPGFALAAYQLAVWSAWNGGPRAELRALIDLALRTSGRAPAKERALIRAWDAHLDGRDAEALALLAGASRDWPEDKQAFYQAGDILRHRDELAAAVPWFERAIALDPDFPWAAGGLAQSLGALGRLDELRAWAARWERAPGPGALHGLSLARGWLGDVRGAAEAARRAGILGAGMSAQEDLLQAELFSGDYDAVRRGAATLAAPGSAVRRIGYYGLAALEAYQGRPRSGLAFLDELARELPEVQGDALYHTVRADYLLGDGNAGAVGSEVEAARRLDPRLAAEHAVSLAWLGDVEHAAALAQDLPRGTVLAETCAALVRLRRGEVEGGLAELRRISDGTPAVSWRVAPLFLYGAELAAAGRDAEAVEALRRAQALYLPLAMWRSWAYPRAQVLLARSLERLGRTGEARQAVDGLLGAWSRAEAGNPLLAEAQALRARLAAR